MKDLEAQQTLVRLVTDWLDGAIDTDVLVDRYWTTRRQLLRSNPKAFDGPVAEVLSHIDTTMDSYWPEPEGPDEIGENDLRRELTGLVQQLRKTGFPMPQ